MSVASAAAADIRANWASAAAAETAATTAAASSSAAAPSSHGSGGKRPKGRGGRVARPSADA